jgi:hypothetical protein
MYSLSVLNKLFGEWSNGADVAFAGVSERRKSQRFDLTLPIHVTRLSEKSVSLVGRTRDVSSSGAYFVVNADVNEGTPIEFFVTLQGGVSSVSKVRLRCLGRITRAESTDEDGHRGIAATIDRYQFVRESLN